MADVLANDLPARTAATIDGTEKGVFFNSSTGLQIGIEELKEYINEGLTFTDTGSGNIVITTGGQ